jgi:hypothetical protein
MTLGHLSLMKLCANVLWMNISIFYFLTFDLQGHWRQNKKKGGFFFGIKWFIDKYKHLLSYVF